MDCVGLNGYRNITMWRNEHHIEIICKTDSVGDVISERISPSQASWIVEDIFLYESCPKKDKNSIKILNIRFLIFYPICLSC